MRDTEGLKIWLSDLAHGNLDDGQIVKGFIRHYALHGMTVMNVQDDLHFRTARTPEQQARAICSLKKALVNFAGD